MQAQFKSVRRYWDGMRELPASARLFVASLAVILVMALFLVALYAGSPDMVPLPLRLTPEVKANAISYLDSAGIFKFPPQPIPVPVCFYLCIL